MEPGDHNDLTDVAGLAVGHHQRTGRGWATGVTVVLAPPGTVGGVDVRGGAPGTRETDLLDPRNLVEHVDAVCLCGGSAYGLRAVTGVVDWLEARGRGFPVGPEPHQVVPIVPAAVLFDLGVGGRFDARPDEGFGRSAAARARRAPVAQGCVGAGTGARAGGLKGGVGSASVRLPDGSTVAALVAVNAAGRTVDPRTGELYGARDGLPGEFADLARPSRADVRAAVAAEAPPPPLNTTLAVVATDAALAKHECARLAGSGQDGLARAIRPVHLMSDGDTVFALSTGTVELPAPGVAPSPTTRVGDSRTARLNQLLAAGADVVSRAVVHAMLHARSMAGLTAYLDRYPSAARSRRPGRR